MVRSTETDNSSRYGHRMENERERSECLVTGAGPVATMPSQTNAVVGSANEPIRSTVNKTTAANSESEFRDERVVLHDLPYCLGSQASTTSSTPSGRHLSRMQHVPPAIWLDLSPTFNLH